MRAAYPIYFGCGGGIGSPDPDVFLPSAYTASPVAADGKVYFTSEDGDVFVIKAGPEYEELAKNSMGEVVMATPAISDGLIIVRGGKNVYAIKAK